MAWTPSVLGERQAVYRGEAAEDSRPQVPHDLPQVRTTRALVNDAGPERHGGIVTDFLYYQLSWERWASKARSTQAARRLL